MTLNDQKINEQIVQAKYYVFPDTTVTVCCIVLKNGFAVVGKSACLDPANFDEETGRYIAYENARDKIWDLEGYRLKENCYARG